MMIIIIIIIIIGKKLTEVSGDQLETSYLFKRLSVAIQREEIKFRLLEKIMIIIESVTSTKTSSVELISCRWPSKRLVHGVNKPLV